jgi:hypothetical protein
MQGFLTETSENEKDKQVTKPQLSPVIVKGKSAKFSITMKSVGILEKKATEAAAEMRQSL